MYLKRESKNIKNGKNESIIKKAACPANADKAAFLKYDISLVVFVYIKVTILIIFEKKCGGYHS